MNNRQIYFARLRAEEAEKQKQEDQERAERLKEDLAAEIAAEKNSENEETFDFLK